MDLTPAEQERVRELLADPTTQAVQVLGTPSGPLFIEVKDAVQVRFEPDPPKPPPRPKRPHWSGNRYTFWQLLSTLGWIRGVVAFPELGEYRCPRL